MNIFKNVLKDVFKKSGSSPVYIDPHTQISYQELENDIQKCIITLSKYNTNNILVKVTDNYKTLVIYISCIFKGVTFIPLNDHTPPLRINKILKELENFILIDSNLNVFEYSQSLRGISSYSNVYRLYTSGTTGSPTPVTITKKNLYYFLKWFLTEQAFFNTDNIFIQPPVTFDGSVIGLYGALACGASIIMLNQSKSKDFQYILSMLKKDITVLVCTPSFLRLCLFFDEFNAAVLTKLRKVILGGEILTHQLYFEIRKRFSNVEIWNSYGLTETTVAITSILLTDEIVAHTDIIPIGYASPYVSIHLNDECEIIVSGKNNANNIKNLYTGDIGECRDNIYFYKGRKDDQIKLNGYRIELEDINMNIKNIHGVLDSTVLLFNNQIIAFVVCCESVYQKLKHSVSKRLPYYMVPKVFVKISSLPLNVNGKIDKKELKYEFEKNNYKSL